MPAFRLVLFSSIVLYVTETTAFLPLGLAVFFACSFFAAFGVSFFAAFLTVFFGVSVFAGAFFAVLALAGTLSAPGSASSNFRTTFTLAAISDHCALSSASVNPYPMSSSGVFGVFR